jgi:hypothetical protein
VTIGDGLAGDDGEVVDDGDAAQVEKVLAGATVTGAAALPVPDVGEGVLDRDALARLRASFRGLLALAQLGQQFLVRGERETLRPLLLVVQRACRGPRRCPWESARSCPARTAWRRRRGRRAGRR